VGTLEADLPASRTNITLALLDLAPDIAMDQSPGSGPGDTSSGVYGDGVFSDDIAMDKRVVVDGRVPSLRIVRGGVKLPANLVDVDAP